MLIHTALRSAHSRFRYRTVSYGPEWAHHTMEEPLHHNCISPSSLNSIPVFQTGDDARHWLERIERHAGVFRWEDRDKLEIARCRLGVEAQVWESGAARGINSWNAFREAFLERYDLREEELYSRLTNCQQGRHETVRQYADRYRHLAAQLNITIERDPAHLYNFLRGLHRRVYHEVYRMRPRTISQAIDDAIYISEGLEEGDSVKPAYGGPAARAEDGRHRILVVPRTTLSPSAPPRPLPRGGDRPRPQERPFRQPEPFRGRVEEAG